MEVPVYELDLTTDCLSQQFEDAVKNQSRVLLYLGFDVIPGFDRVLLTNLAQFGGMSAYREFSQLGLAAVIDSRTPASGSNMRLKRTTTSEQVDRAGCISVRRAARW